MYIHVAVYTFRGLWMPSKMFSMIPGPSSTERGLPVLSTGSPIVTPARTQSRPTHIHTTHGTHVQVHVHVHVHCVYACMYNVYIHCIISVVQVCLMHYRTAWMVYSWERVSWDAAYVYSYRVCVCDMQWWWIQVSSYT